MGTISNKIIEELDKKIEESLPIKKLEQDVKDLKSEVEVIKTK